MKKILLSLFLLFSLAVTAAAAGTDVITNAILNKGTAENSNGYTDVVTNDLKSGAVYAGKINLMSSKTYYYFGMNSNTKSSDLVTTKSGGIAKKIIIKWSTTGSTTPDGNKIEVYGQDEAYTAGDKGKGKLIGSSSKGSDATTTIDLSSNTFQYIAVHAVNAIYVESIEIEWVDPTPAGPVDANAKFENIDIVYNPNEPNLKPVVTTPANFLAHCANLTYTIVPANVIDCTDKDNLKILAPVEGATMTAAWKANDKYNEGSTSFTVTVKKNENPGLKYSATTATATIGEKYELPTLTNDYNLPVTYSSSKPEFAEINEEGGVTLKAAGETVIKATFTGNDLIAGGEVSYTLTVNAEKPLEAPTFSLVDGGSYDYGMELVISTTAADATLEYSTDAENYLPYIGPITLDKAGEWTVFARVTKGSQTEEDAISFTVNKLKYTYEFGAVAEQMVGRDRYFTMPALVGAEGVEVKYEATGDGVVVKNPGSIKGIEDAYFIIGDGTAVVKATIAGDNTYDEFTKTLDVTIVPEETKTETKKNVEFDFSKLDELGLNNFSASEKNEQYIQLAERTLEKSGVKISFAANNGTLGPRIAVANNYMAIYKPKSGDGGAFTITATQISKVEITIGKNDAGTYAYTEGVLSNLVSKVRTWTPKDGKPVDCFTLTNKGSNNPQITKIKVYYTEVTEGGEPAQSFNMAFSAKEYELEEGDLMPNVVLPDDFTGEVKYLVNGEPKNVGYRFPASEEAYEIKAYTEGDAKRLPAVDKTIVYAYGYELADVLAIHYSTENTPVHYSTVAYSAPKTIDGDVHRYEFTDIDVKGYDGVDGKTYGHVFFSFTPAPGEAPALAPRREAAEGDWASFNANTDIYSAATHLTEAGENTPLVRHRAGTLGDAMPAVFRVQSSAETGQMYNFTVNLDKNGTSSVTAVQSQTQTGVESVGVDADGEAEYYTLQGVRVAKPAAGIYLRRQGGTVSKVLVK